MDYYDPNQGSMYIEKSSFIATPARSNAYKKTKKAGLFRPHGGRISIKKTWSITTLAGSNVYRDMRLRFTTTPAGSHVYKKQPPQPSKVKPTELKFKIYFHQIGITIQ